MEHPCHQCNTAVEDGVPFCPKCGAPQIRVVSDDNEPVTGPMPPGTPGEIQPPAQPVYGTPAPWMPAPTLNPDHIHWRIAFPSALLIGLSGGLISLFMGRIPALLLLIPMATGALTVWAYRRRTRALVRPFAGMKLGVFAGMFSFLLSAIAVVGMFTLGRGMVQQSMREAMSLSSKNVDPQSLQIMQKMVDQMNTPEGLITICIVILFVLFAITFLFSAVGGALGAAMFGKDRPAA